MAAIFPRWRLCGILELKKKTEGATENRTFKTRKNDENNSK